MKESGRLSTVFVGLIILLVTSFITCRPVPSSTLPTEPSSSPKFQLPEGKTQKLVLEDDFSNSNSGWLTVAGADRGGSYENGEYVLWIKQTGSIMAVPLAVATGVLEASDFVIEIDAREVSGEKGSYCFIRYRWDENENLYAVGFSDNSEYSIVKYEMGRATVLLKDWTRSSHIKAGKETNRIMIVCIGTQTDVYANGHKLATVTDDASLKGRITLGIKSFSESGVKYSFDNFKFYAIQ